MVPRDNRTMLFSIELHNCIIPFANHKKIGHYNIWRLTSWFLVCNVDKTLLWDLKIPAKVTGDSSLIHDIYIFIIRWSLFVIQFHMTGYSHSYHSIKLIHCSVPQREVLSDKMVFWVVTHSFCFMLCQSYLLSTVISFLYKNKWWWLILFISCFASLLYWILS